MGQAWRHNIHHPKRVLHQCSCKTPYPCIHVHHVPVSSFSQWWNQFLVVIHSLWPHLVILLELLRGEAWNWTADYSWGNNKCPFWPSLKGSTSNFIFTLHIWERRYATVHLLVPKLFRSGWAAATNWANTSQKESKAAEILPSRIHIIALTNLRSIIDLPTVNTFYMIDRFLPYSKITFLYDFLPAEPFR